MNKNLQGEHQKFRIAGHVSDLKKRKKKKLFWPSSEYIHIRPDKLNQPLPGPLLSFSSHLSDFLFGWLGVNSYPRAMHKLIQLGLLWTLIRKVTAPQSIWHYQWLHFLEAQLRLLPAHLTLLGKGINMARSLGWLSNDTNSLSLHNLGLQSFDFLYFHSLLTLVAGE